LREPPLRGRSRKSETTPDVSGLKVNNPSFLHVLESSTMCLLYFQID
jgi:hypothetical protein